MRTFTVVDSVSYPGTLYEKPRLVWEGNVPMHVNESYLSADLGDGNWISVEGFDVDEAFLREALIAAIRKKLADGRLVN